LARGYLCRYGQCKCYKTGYVYGQQLGCFDPSKRFQTSINPLEQFSTDSSSLIYNIPPNPKEQKNSKVAYSTQRNQGETASEPQLRSANNFAAIPIRKQAATQNSLFQQHVATSAKTNGNNKEKEETLSEMLLSLQKLSAQFERSLGEDVNTKTNKFVHSVDRRQSLGSSNLAGSLLSFVLPLVKGFVKSPAPVGYENRQSVVRRDETSSLVGDAAAVSSDGENSSAAVANSLKTFIDTVQPVVPALRELRMRLSVIRKVRSLIQRIQARVRALRSNLFQRVNANIL